MEKIDDLINDLMGPTISSELGVDVNINSNGMEVYTDDESANNSTNSHSTTHDITHANSGNPLTTLISIVDYFPNHETKHFITIGVLVDIPGSELVKAYYNDQVKEVNDVLKSGSISFIEQDRYWILIGQISFMNDDFDEEDKAAFVEFMKVAPHIILLQEKFNKVNIE